MGEDGVRVEPVDEHIDIVDAVVGDVVDQLVHLLGVFIEVGQGVLKAHKEVALLENAGAHKAGGELFLPGQCAAAFKALLPALLTVGFKIRRVDKLPPAGDVRADLVLLCDMGRSSRRVGREQDGGAPAVNADGAGLAVAPQIGVDGVGQHHLYGFILHKLPLRLPVGLQKLQKYFFRCGHGDPFLYFLICQNTGRECDGFGAVIIREPRLLAHVADQQTVGLHGGQPLAGKAAGPVRIGAFAAEGAGAGG